MKTSSWSFRIQFSLTSNSDSTSRRRKFEVISSSSCSSCPPRPAGRCCHFLRSSGFESLAWGSSQQRRTSRPSLERRTGHPLVTFEPNRSRVGPVLVLLQKIITENFTSSPASKGWRVKTRMRTETRTDQKIKVMMLINLASLTAP